VELNRLTEAGLLERSKKAAVIKKYLGIDEIVVNDNWEWVREITL
jgi:hypothetical protein